MKIIQTIKNVLCKKNTTIKTSQPTDNKVVKSWGHYIDILRTKTRTIKTLYFSPNSKISNQKHTKRKETWYVLSGSGQAVLEDSCRYSVIYRDVYPGDSFVVDANVWHQVKADENTELVVLEIQEGIDCDENDIIRKDDVL